MTLHVRGERNDIEPPHPPAVYTEPTMLQFVVPPAQYHSRRQQQTSSDLQARDRTLHINYFDDSLVSLPPSWILSSSPCVPRDVVRLSLGVHFVILLHKQTKFVCHTTPRPTRGEDYSSSILSRLSFFCFVLFLFLVYFLGVSTADSKLECGEVHPSPSEAQVDSASSDGL